MAYFSDAEAGKGFQVKLQWAGFKEFEDLLTEIEDDFGEKDAKKILRNACRMAMEPVLKTAQGLLEMHGNVDTGQLLKSLQVEARKPTARDKRSKYSTPTIVMLSRVTVAPGNKLKKMKFYNQRTRRKQIGAQSDARAYAIEFGTARWLPGEGKPFLRPALESNAQTVTDNLTQSLRQALLKYKSKYMVKK